MSVSPCGSWKSPITADLIVAETIALGDIVTDGEAIYWVETRPGEGGRCVVVRHARDGQPETITPPGYSTRTRVHEYGGGSFTVHEGVVYFVNDQDQQIYRQPSANDSPQPVTPEGNRRYADLIVDHAHNRLICIQEDHGIGDEPTNSLVAVALDPVVDAATELTQPTVLESGHDFYSSPALSADGKKLAWICWDHPNMPWDGSQIWVAEFATDGTCAARALVAGGSGESIFQPLWHPNGHLHFVSDRSGWWNHYRWNGSQVSCLWQMEAEFGLPQWVFGMSTYGIDGSGDLICSYRQRGEWQLARLRLDVPSLEALTVPFTEITGIRCHGEHVLFHGGSPTSSAAIWTLNLRTERLTELRRSSSIDIDAGFLSRPRPIEFPTDGGVSAHALFYPPRNADYRAPEDERPPLLVKSHGGPTSSASSELNLGIQYWTSRGFAVLDVDYGGSTGYGRAYRRRLEGNWGIVDVRDCVNAARFVAEAGLVDGERTVIRGSSAGGYTTLAALTFFDQFRAGAVHYGISDLEALARHTHKFESRYLDQLIGPYPQARALYQQRSPIHYVEALSAPVIFFQGLEDKVVPPNQAKTMVAALDAKGIPVAYVAYEGEQHGFRQAKNIKKTLHAELYFYSRIFGFTLAEPVEPVVIENLPETI